MNHALLSTVFLPSSPLQLSSPFSPFSLPRSTAFLPSSSFRLPPGACFQCAGPSQPRLRGQAGENGPIDFAGKGHGYILHPWRRGVILTLDLVQGKELSISGTPALLKDEVRSMKYEDGMEDEKTQKFRSHRSLQREWVWGLLRFFPSHPLGVGSEAFRPQNDRKGKCGYGTCRDSSLWSE